MSSRVCLFIGGPKVAIRFDYLRGGRQVSLRERGHLLILAKVTAGAALLATLPACAQYPVQMSRGDKNVEMRAVAVLEWTGEEEHPKASRLVPITLYDGQDLQDAGIYLARPAPLALSSEVEYELKQGGKTVGLFDVNNAGQEQGSWVGFGVWKPLPKPKPAAQAAKAKVDDWGGDVQSDRPTLHRKGHSDDSSATGKGGSSGSDSTGQAADPDRPTLHKKTSSDGSSDSGSTSSSAPSDPDRPTLHKKPSSDSSGDTNSNSSSDNSPASAPTDPDRPTLHKKSSDSDTAGSGTTAAADPDRPTLKKKGGKAPADVGYVESMQNSSDPDRPKLQRGKVSAEGVAVVPTLMGLPPEMHQAVAVSDARSRPEHLWSYSWSNPDDEAKMKAEMEDIARKALGLTPPPPPTPAPKRPATATRKKATPPPAPSPAPLLDEQFRVFELAYGSGATMVLSAHSDGTGAKQKFVTLVGQPDLYGNVLVLLKNVTDAAHLDDTPRMRLVDAVDAMADNRGELLFELRGATQRQFALYRVLRGQADKLFVSGPGGIAPPPSGE
jgi:hypothetical protein